MIGLTIFYGAYMAETIRGGLQALPRGQFEAAAALGLNYWKSTIFIILPQALKYVIPGIVGTFIPTLFQDRIGHRRSTVLFLVVWIAATVGFAGYAFMRERYLAVGMEARSVPFAKLSEFVRSEIAKWGKVVKASGARLEG